MHRREPHSKLQHACYIHRSRVWMLHVTLNNILTNGLHINATVTGHFDIVINQRYKAQACWEPIGGR